MQPDSAKQPEKEPSRVRWATTQETQEQETQLRTDSAATPSQPINAPHVESIGSATDPSQPQSKLIFHRISPDTHESTEPQPTDRLSTAHEKVPPPPPEHSAKPPLEPSAKDFNSRDPSSKNRSRRNIHPNPITQSLMLLCTMGFMLAAARFAVPTIVEEIRYAWHRGELRAEYETGTEGLKNVSLDALSEAYQMVTSAVGPSVVHIEVDRQKSSSGLLARSNAILPASDQGSGVVVDDAGFVITNRHVIAEGKSITVTLSDGRQVPANIVGTDPLTDLAVLKIDANGLMPIAWGDSERCRVGSPVWAVGSPFGLDRTITFGILSGKHRMVRASTRYQDFMQSDVAVNPGNSGGPLVDARGTLIGINTAIVGDTYQGVSFSIPSSVVKKVYLRLRETGRVDRGWLGVALSEVPDDQMVGDNHRVRGALVTGIAEQDSPAALAGVQAGDVIIEVNGSTIRDMGHVMRKIGNELSGSTVRMKISRNGKTLDINVRLKGRPERLNQ